MQKGTGIEIFIEHESLSVEELKKLMQCLREIEQNKPQRTIYILFHTPEKTVKEMEGIFDSIKPVLPHKLVIEFKKGG